MVGSPRSRARRAGQWRPIRRRPVETPPAASRYLSRGPVRAAPVIDVPTPRPEALMTHPAARRRPLLLELLEDRSVPSATASFAAGTLSVTGSSGNDTIVVRRVNDVI